MKYYTGNTRLIYDMEEVKGTKGLKKNRKQFQTEKKE